VAAKERRALAAVLSVKGALRTFHTCGHDKNAMAAEWAAVIMQHAKPWSPFHGG
jgi:hypothetical protein